MPWISSIKYIKDKVVIWWETEWKVFWNLIAAIKA